MESMRTRSPGLPSETGAHWIAMLVIHTCAAIALGAMEALCAHEDGEGS